MDINIDDAKLWIGELYLENKVLKKQLIRLRSELEAIKMGYQELIAQTEKGEIKMGGIKEDNG